MSLCLAHWATSDRADDLRCAIGCDAPSVDALVDGGIPRYRAHDLHRRLTSAGEISNDQWQPQARADYARLLEPTAPSATASATSSAGPVGRLHQLPADQRPREKAAQQGVASLTDSELLAVLLRTGGQTGVLELADHLLAEYDGLIGLAAQDVADLVQAQGIGPAKATELAAAFELGRRLAQARRRERPVLTTPEAVVALIGAELAPLPHEQLWCLPLDPRSRLIGEPRVVSSGDIDGTDAGPRAFFRAALRAGAASAIAVHNHPTGDPSPSAADHAVTRRLAAAGRAVDVALVDHLVIGDGGRFTSLRRVEPSLFT